MIAALMLSTQPLGLQAIAQTQPLMYRGAACAHSCTADALKMVAVREAAGEELQAGRSTSAFRIAGLLCADAMFQPKSQTERQILASALSSDLADRFSSRNRAAHALFVAEDESADDPIIGCCAIEMRLLSPTGNDERGATQGQLQPRPLLSSLAVSTSYRRRGIAQRLCREAEKAARAWGSNEVLLKVEQTNNCARRLYRKLGYRQVAIDTGAEKPQATTGRLRFERTTNVVMRKDLRSPPVDTLLSYVVATLLTGLLAMYSQQQGLDASGIQLLLSDVIADSLSSLGVQLPF